MDQELNKLILLEQERQNSGIELIASENYASKDVRSACGSILTNKYAEGFPGHRYYGGCEVIDEVENLAINRACELFGCKFTNVQPHSGSQAIKRLSDKEFDGEICGIEEFENIIVTGDRGGFHYVY